jgi:uncharacterized lipoprotein YbaY
MKTIGSLILAGLVCGFAGCSNLEVTRGTNPDRVLSGKVNARTALPAGAEIVVRLLAPAATQDPLRAAGADVPVVTRPTVHSSERVLAEQTITLQSGTSDPVPFRIAYYAEDALLRRGLNLEARVSFGGRLRFRTVQAHPVTLNSSFNPQDVSVQAIGP